MINRFRTMLPTLLMTLAALLLAACTITEESITGIHIDAQGQTLTLAPGEGLQLAARATGSEAPPSVNWHSSQADVATVDATGLVMALAEGSTNITATSSANQDLRDSVVITVLAAAGPASPLLLILPDGEGTVSVDPGGPYSQDTLVTLTAEAADGWHFVRWAGDLDGTVNPETLLMDADKAITAVFEQTLHELHVNIIGEGEVTGFSAEPYPAGSTVTISAMPVAGWDFDGWTGAVTGSDRTINLTVDEDMEITAVFVYSYNTCSADEPIFFQDKIVDRFVRELYDVSGVYGDPITCAQVQRQIPLDPDPDNDGQERANLLDLNRCDAEPIESLEGLQHLIHLVRLELSCNELDDISQLAGLTGLVELNLDFNEISDLTPLAGLENLEVLGLYDNKIIDLTPLSGLVNLRILYASENYIKNVEPLTELQKLEHLWLYLNCTDTEYELDDSNEPYIVHWEDCLTDVRPLASLPGLQSLILAINEVEDISAVSGMESLQLLHVTGNQVDNIAPLQTLPALQTVTLDTNLISNLYPLANNPDFPGTAEPFHYVRGTVTMPSSGVFVNLTLHENCLDTSVGGQQAAYHELLQMRANVKGFNAAQANPARCVPLSSQHRQHLPLIDKQDRQNDILQQLRRDRSR